MKIMLKRGNFLIAVLFVVMIASLLVACGPGSQEKEAWEKPNEITYEFNKEHTEVTIFTEGENLEYTADGETWQDSNVFPVEKEKTMTLGARFKEDDTHKASEASIKIITTRPDETKFSVASTPDVFGSITVDLKGNPNIYEFSVQLGPWSEDLVYEVEEETVNFRARLKKTALVDYSDFVSFDVSGITLNPDIDSAKAVNVPHSSSAAEVFTNTDSEGLNIREDVVNNRSFKLTTGTVANNFTFNIVKPDEYAGCSFDIKIMCDGYDDTAYFMVDNEGGRYNLLGAGVVNEWKSVVLPRGYMALDFKDCSSAQAGTFRLYIDNIEYLTESEVEEFNARSTKLIENADVESTTFLTPQEALDPSSARGVTFGADAKAFLFTAPADNGYGWRYGVKFNDLKITDLTDYGGIAFYTWMPSVTAGEYAFFTDASVVSNETYNDTNSSNRWSIKNNVLVGVHDAARGGWQKHYISKDALTAAGYDVTKFTSFTLLFCDITEKLLPASEGSNLFQGTGQLYIMDIEAYKENTHDTALVENGDISKATLLSEYPTDCTVSKVANAINLKTNGYGHKQNLKLSFDAVNLTNARGIELYISVINGFADKEDLMLYTKAGLTTDEEVKNLDLSTATLIGTYGKAMYAGDPSLYGTVLKITLTTEDLTSAGYDIANFNHFNIVYCDGITSTAGVTNIMVRTIKTV